MLSKRPPGTRSSGAAIFNFCAAMTSSRMIKMRRMYSRKVSFMKWCFTAGGPSSKIEKVVFSAIGGHLRRVVMSALMPAKNFDFFEFRIVNLWCERKRYTKVDRPGKNDTQSEAH